MAPPKEKVLHAIYIARSDGKGYQNLDYTPITTPQDKYQLERWEVTIGGHLKRQLAPKDEKRRFKLASLPKGYELRCAVRSDGGRDYYCYGHPGGSKFSYRTPGDMVLHIMWLVSNSHDYRDCSCLNCAKYLQKQKSLQKAGAAGAAGASVATLSRTSNSPAPTISQVPPSTSIQATPSQAAMRQPVPAGPTPVAAVGTIPAPLPGVTSLADVFRVGEMVWYKHSAWRLGVIIEYFPFPGAGPGQTPVDYHGEDYTVVPLGHYLLGMYTAGMGVQDMRPFLTFSVPAIEIEELKSKSFAEIKWRAFATRWAKQAPDAKQRNTRLQKVGLDATKMAAKHVNDAWSTFNKLSEYYTPDGMYTLQSYTGVYLGAEMICILDAVRIAFDAADTHIPAPVMRVSDIHVRLPTPTNPSPEAPALEFKGNVYRLIRGAQQQHPGGIVSPENLGPAFVEEACLRNKLVKDQGTRWGWVVVEQDARRVEQDILGRFYVTDKLLKIIEPDKFRQSWENGVLEEASTYLNQRVQAGRNGVAGRQPSRATTIGQAVAIRIPVPPGMTED